MGSTINTRDFPATSTIVDSSIEIQVKGWIRFKILSWLLKDAYKIRVVRDE